MKTTLSFRKESIQQSSHASETLNQAAHEFTEAQGLKHARDQRPISLTTLLTL
ncbi:hypothetical protein [Geothrix oryzisoli]|uniref:hypothetical protein n=1 Tax=Geothrix oryzisoli TaxID=2922721 RepID=UPI001FAB7785|nr:hypothetical protein [Geothrix oryzisoli]